MDSSAPTSGVKPEALDVKKLISQYVRLRERKRILEANFKETIAPFAKFMTTIEGQLLEHMQKAGIDSVSTPEGTAYQSTTPRATIKDKSAFREWVVDQEQFDLVDWRANAPAVFEYIAENKGVAPPGVSPSTFTAVRFRSPSEED